jgi:hypothetical protein
MTALGKILVFVNLAFSVVTCALIVIVFATRTNWKTEYERVKKQGEINNAAYQADVTKLTKDVEDERVKTKQVEGLLKNSRAETAQAIEDKKKVDEQLVAVNTAKSGSDGNVNAIAQELKRIKEEREALVKEREGLRGQVVALTDNVNTEKRRAVDAEIKVKTLVERNGRLLEQNGDQARQISNLKSGGGSAAPSASDSATASKAAGGGQTVRGQVVSADTNTGLTTISIGSDAGVTRGDKLEVYRLDPDPKKSLYVGSISVLTTRPKEAVGQFSAASKRVAIKPGDEVSSSILGDGR